MNLEMLALAAASGQDRPLMALSARDRAILDFERTWRQRPGPKEVAIREQFRMSRSRYYELLRSLLDEPDALAYDPLTVKRAQRVRHHRRRVRIAGRRAEPPLSSPSQAPALRQRSAKPPLPRSR
jgi:hypothetical protein